MTFKVPRTNRRAKSKHMIAVNKKNSIVLGTRKNKLGRTAMTWLQGPYRVNLKACNGLTPLLLPFQLLGPG